MKKLILAALAALALVPAPARAQTDFRHITYDEARQAAVSEGKLLFIDFFTEWCGPCKRMASQVFPTKEVGDYMNAKFVAIKIDAEKGEGPALAKKYGVKAYPTFIICNADGSAIGEFAGYKEGNAFIAKVESCSNPELNPERVKALYEGGDRTPQIVQAYAGNIVDNSRDYLAALEQAGKIVDGYWAGLSEQQRLDPVNMFVYETYPPAYGTDRFIFLVEKRAKFDPSKAEAVNKLIEDIHEREAISYLTSKAITDEASRKAFEGFKASSKALGLDRNYETILAFADKRSGMSYTEYVAYVDKNFDKLTSEQQGILLSSLKGAFNPQTPEEVKAASDFGRRRIGSLPADQLLWTAYALHELEAKGH
ncbi:MAG: thioredoxin family protein [Duncaniella sp.]|nr:thioredoxin family protein [Duncaniella sp.]